MFSPSTVVMWLFYWFCYVLQEGGKQAPELITGTLFRKHKSIYLHSPAPLISYEGWNFNSGNYLFTTDTK